MNRVILIMGRFCLVIQLSGPIGLGNGLFVLGNELQVLGNDNGPPALCNGLHLLGIMSNSALCHIRHYVTFGLMSFGYVSFGVLSLGLMSFGIMSFGFLSVYQGPLCTVQ